MRYIQFTFMPMNLTGDDVYIVYIYILYMRVHIHIETFSKEVLRAIKKVVNVSSEDMK